MLDAWPKASSRRFVQFLALVGGKFGANLAPTADNYNSTRQPVRLGRTRITKLLCCVLFHFRLSFKLFKSMILDFFPATKKEIIVQPNRYRRLNGGVVQ